MLCLSGISSEFFVDMMFAIVDLRTVFHGQPS